MAINVNFEQLRVVEGSFRLMATMMNAQDDHRMRIHEGGDLRPTLRGYGTTEVDMPERKIKALVDRGVTTTMEHLKNRGAAPRHRRQETNASARGGWGPGGPAASADRERRGTHEPRGSVAPSKYPGLADYD